MKLFFKPCFGLFLFLAIILLTSCSPTDSGVDDAVLISGEVINQTTGNTIEDALVEITAPSALRQTTTTDSIGTFSFLIEADSAIQVSIQAEKQGFNAQTTTFRVVPENEYTGITLELQSQDTGGGDEDGVSGESGGAAAIILENVTESAINIAETGGVVNSAFTFAVQDSAGRAIDLANAVDVHFSIVSGPGGGESLTPSVVRTNARGLATSNLFAGNAAGVVKIQAEITRDDISLVVRSKPIVISIHGGYPDDDHFSISAGLFNFEGFSRDGIRNPISVIVGDRFSNPVKPGTPVYFSSTGGIIQGSGETNGDGEISVDLISGGNRQLLDHPTLGFGYATVTAVTYDENDAELVKEINILFSGPPSTSNITVTPSTFSIPANGSASFSYVATDINGNPLPAGTSVSIEVAEGLEASGDVDFEIPNALFPGPGVTEFTFTVADVDDEASNVQGTEITIKVETPAGDKAQRTVSGDRAKTR